MTINLGPWTAEPAVDADVRASLAAAMEDQAWNTVKSSAGFTPVKIKPGKVKARGYTIEGRLTSVKQSGRTVEVRARFSVLVDGFISTLPTVEGQASASGGGFTAEDALRAATESRVKAMLQAIKSGRVGRLG